MRLNVLITLNEYFSRLIFVFCVLLLLLVFVRDIIVISLSGILRVNEILPKVCAFASKHTGPEVRKAKFCVIISIRSYDNTYRSGTDLCILFWIEDGALLHVSHAIYLSSLTSNSKDKT